jgi:hypothetical protein
VKKSPSSPPSKKRKGKAGTDVSPLPTLKDWPVIALKSITGVTLDILKRLVSCSLPCSLLRVGQFSLICISISSQRVLDEDNLFGIPVVEAYPSVAYDYAKAISKPMDFRTIEEERIPVYRCIADLQQDLILIFGNCIQFNGAASDYGTFAL